MKMTPKDRFLSKIRQEDGHWLWTGYRMPTGYAGFFRLDGKDDYAHRVAHALFIGPIPDGAVIDHLCRVRHCVNPAHIEAVPQKENVRRGNASVAVAESNRRRAAARTHCKHGHELATGGVYLEVNQRGYTVRKCATCVRDRARARTRARRHPGAP